MTNEIATMPTLDTIPAGKIIGAAFGLRIVQRTTPEDHEAAGRPNVARVMRERGQTADLVGQRGNGHKLHLVAEFDRGHSVGYSYIQAI